MSVILGFPIRASDIERIVPTDLIAGFVRTDAVPAGD